MCEGWKEDKFELDRSAVLYIPPRVLSQSVALRMVIVRSSVIPPEGVSPILSCSLNLIGTGVFLASTQSMAMLLQLHPRH